MDTMRLGEGKFWLSVVLIGVSLRGAAAHTLQSAEIAAGEVSKTAVRAATGTVTVVNIPWSFPSNRIDWLFNPTAKKGPFNPEWTWQLNRMSFWEDMGRAYRATKDERYARAFAVQLRDWLDQTGGVPPESGYNGAGSPWRTIEEGLRLMNAWPAAEDAFGGSPAFTPELKRRFVAAMHAQAKHLMAHRTCRNWLLMEMTGTYTFATRQSRPRRPAMRPEAAAPPRSSATDSPCRCSRFPAARLRSGRASREAGRRTPARTSRPSSRDTPRTCPSRSTFGSAATSTPD